MQFRSTAAATLAAIICAACSDQAPDDAVGESDGAAPIHDAAQADATAASEPDAAAPSSSDGGAQDSSSAPLDSAAPAEAGEVTADGGARDGASSSTDAGDAGPSSEGKVCASGQTYGSPLPPEGQRTAQPVGTLSFGFIEGPLWLAEQGVLLFSDMDMGGGNAMGPPAKVWRLMPPTTFSVFAPTSNSNGLALYTDGRILAATHDNQGLSWFDPATSTKTPIAVQASGKSLNSPNDLAVRSDGTVYVTDPDYQRGARPEVTKVRGLYRIKPPLVTSGTNEAILLDGTLTQPNGVALSPDEKTLYVGSSGAEIWKFTVAADGSVSDRVKFAEPGASDGLTVDCAGNLYVTSGEVEVFAPNGTRLGGISVGGGPTNVAFGDADRKTLYITAGSKLYSIRLNVPGYPY